MCDFNAGPQDNWAFTQHIRYLEAREVVIVVDFKFTDCFRFRACTQNSVTLHRFDTDVQDSAAQVDPLNYIEIAELVQTSTRDDSQLTLRFDNPITTAGFYLAIHDTGTCGSIKRIQVYYQVCNRLVDNLVTYPELPFPPADSVDSPTIGEATCTANSALNPLVSSSNEISVLVSGECLYDVTCRCNEGYEEDPPANQPGRSAGVTCIGALKIIRLCINYITV